ncbi:hypothetical protein BKA67DRAFT_536588 [Truncatella angustata]|uniref:Uncharacterized protein n=1 Tax=Truncatella angustata TaxID=152316 RepID=A0A9P8ZWB4_9PEZI|nr:uncharacterized protein BKA67DRAFT_536588 [Truncatella angustata]KAH6652876.1 hypothetical protein BKA67DRAFT_536588 [Truncatella angustata]
MSEKSARTPASVAWRAKTPMPTQQSSTVRKTVSMRVEHSWKRVCPDGDKVARSTVHPEAHVEVCQAFGSTASVEAFKSIFLSLLGQSEFLHELPRPVFVVLGRCQSHSCTPDQDNKDRGPYNRNGSGDISTCFPMLHSPSEHPRAILGDGFCQRKPDAYQYCSTRAVYVRERNHILHSPQRAVSPLQDYLAAGTDSVNGFRGDYIVLTPNFINTIKGIEIVEKTYGLF